MTGIVLHDPLDTVRTGHIIDPHLVTLGIGIAGHLHVVFPIRISEVLGITVITITTILVRSIAGCTSISRRSGSLALGLVSQELIQCSVFQLSSPVSVNSPLTMVAVNGLVTLLSFRFTV